MQSLLGGVSVLDADRLSVRNLDQAGEFIRSYGYEWDDPEDRKIIDSHFRQALAFLNDQFLDEGVEIPEEISNPKKIEDLRQILLFASDRNLDGTPLKKWSCAALKVMHIIAHLNNDLYAIFQDQIRGQILGPIKEHVYRDAVQGISVLQTEGNDEKIRLSKFEIKPGKNQNSAVIKLLAKKRLVALNILDRVGIRFVTKTTFDIFRVIRFLVNQGLVSYPHCIVNESANMVYPTNLFLETMDALRSSNPMAGDKEIEDALDKKLEDHGQRAEYQEKDNIFTAPDYKFIKFISRKLIKIKLGDEVIRFFYPFEIQIMGYQTHLNNMRGQLSHDQYKKRQIKSAKIRLFGKN